MGVETLARAVLKDRIEDVYNVVAKMVHSTIRPGQHEVEDLIQDGMVGVMNAIDKWDSEKMNLTTYATMCAKHWILSRVFQRDATDRCRVNTIALSLNAPRFKDYHRDDAGREMTLEDTVPDDSDLIEELIDRISAEEVRERMQSMFDERTLYIIESLYCTEPPKTQRELARELGLSHQRIQQIEKNAKDRLRRVLGRQ